MGPDAFGFGNIPRASAGRSIPGPARPAQLVRRQRAARLLRRWADRASTASRSLPTLESATWCQGSAQLRRQGDDRVRKATMAATAGGSDSSSRPTSRIEHTYPSREVRRQFRGIADGAARDQRVRHRLTTDSIETTHRAAWSTHRAAEVASEQAPSVLCSSASTRGMPRGRDATSSVGFGASRLKAPSTRVDQHPEPLHRTCSIGDDASRRPAQVPEGEGPGSSTGSGATHRPVETTPSMRDMLFSRQQRPASFALDPTNGGGKILFLDLRGQHRERELPTWLFPSSNGRS